MNDDDYQHALELVRLAAVDRSFVDRENLVIGELLMHFYLVPRRVMAGHPPSLLREQAHHMERDDLPWTAQWLRELADATED